MRKQQRGSIGIEESRGLMPLKCSRIVTCSSSGHSCFSLLVQSYPFYPRWSAFYSLAITTPALRVQASIYRPGEEASCSGQLRVSARGQSISCCPKPWDGYRGVIFFFFFVFHENFTSHHAFAVCIGDPTRKILPHEPASPVMVMGGGGVLKYSCQDI